MRATILLLCTALLLAPTQARAGSPKGYRLAHRFALAGIIVTGAAPVLWLSAVAVSKTPGNTPAERLPLFAGGIVAAITGPPLLAAGAQRDGTLVTRSGRPVSRLPGRLAWIGWGVTVVLLPTSALVGHTTRPVADTLLVLGVASYFGGLACGITQLRIDDSAARQVQQWADVPRVLVTPVYTPNFRGAEVTILL